MGRGYILELGAQSGRTLAAVTNSGRFRTFADALLSMAAILAEARCLNKRPASVRARAPAPGMDKDAEMWDNPAHLRSIFAPRNRQQHDP